MSTYDVAEIALDASVVARFRVALASLITVIATTPPDTDPDLEAKLQWARVVAWDQGTEDNVARAAARLARGAPAFQEAAEEGVPADQVDILDYQSVLLTLFAIFKDEPEAVQALRPNSVRGRS